MPKVVLNAQIAAAAGRIWETVHEFARSAGWSPLQGTADPGGGSEHAERYALGPVIPGIKGCSLEIRVTDNGDGSSSVAWTGVFSAPGGEETMAVRALQRLFHSGMSRLENTLGSAEGE